MKSLRLSLLALLATASTSLLPAQLASAPAGASAAPAESAPVKPVEVARIAYINSSAFLDTATGIKQLVRAAQSLQNEFANTEAELSLLNEKLRTIAGEINRLQADPVANAKALSDNQTAGLALQKELQTKQQAAQAEYAKRQQELQGPVAAEIGKELRAFTKARDISMLFDAAKLEGALLDAKPELDVTPDFIAQFNASHP